MQAHVNSSQYYATKMWLGLGTERETERRNKSEKPLLANMYILHGTFEDEAATYATLLQFSEFYKTTGEYVPV